MKQTSSTERNPAERVRIAFGSCNNQHLENNLWGAITERDPVAFVWAGDAIYADINEGFDWSTLTTIRSPATPQRLNDYYKIQKRDASYRSFLEKTNPTVTGTIDDHDMGINNGDETFQYKRESGVEFLDFLREDRNSVMYRRAKNGDGVYGVKVFDFDRPEGQYLLSDDDAGIEPDVVGFIEKQKTFKDKRVAIFLLDARTNRSPWGKGFASWRRNYDGDFLGEKQWKWLEKALQHSDASVNIIVNGMQVHPFRHPSANLAENWAQFPSSRQRLYDAILRENVRSPVLLSGDVHMAQLMRKNCLVRNKRGAPLIRPLVEFTSSGMTHSWGSLFASTKKYHDSYKYYPMHVLSKTVMTLIHWILPMPDLMITDEPFEGAKLGKQFSLEKNFGEVEINWQERTVTLRAFGHVEKAPPLLSTRFSMGELSGIESTPSDADAIKMIKDYFFVDGDIIEGDHSICVNVQGPASVTQFFFAVIGVSAWLLLPQLLLLFYISKRLCRRWEHIHRK